jgi:hypothetical protein
MMAHPLQEARVRLAAAYDRSFTAGHRLRIQQATVYLSVAGFALHLLLVAAARSLPAPPVWVAAAGTHYVAALFTPFSFILFYEVLALIWALPESTSQSIAKQFEIVSLIVIRGAFKDIARMDQIGTLRHPAEGAAWVVFDMCGGLVMFLLVAVFFRASRRRSRVEAALQPDPALHRFIAQKKAVAFLLTLLLLGMAAFNLGQWIGGVSRTPAAADVKIIFYTDLFTVMIFTDVLVLLLSLLVSDHYELVFRNAAFVLSTILIRYSLTATHPENVVVAVFGMVFGILTLFIYNYYSGLAAVPQASG